MEKWIKELDELTTHIDEWTDEDIFKSAHKILVRKTKWSGKARTQVGPIIHRFLGLLARLKEKYPEGIGKLKLEARKEMEEVTIGSR